MPKNVSAQHSSISLARSYNGPCSPPSNLSSSWEWGSPVKAACRARALKHRLKRCNELKSGLELKSRYPNSSPVSQP
ncbi:hypothetical protein C8F04DRAFT_1274919 [Mycena alexandri]|uniref:Uncharacterized protein n=1 Tax=Mycena alexandri TaxID=1745969 RepID=A0AAD6S7G4_9AGAR|nr:hypothetical protein C8F04DRAFT_1274919 [Mycena alexandri]